MQKPVLGESQASIHVGQMGLGKTVGAPLWDQRLTGRAAAPLHSTLHCEPPHSQNCHQRFSPKRRVQPVPLQRDPASTDAERGPVCTSAAPLSQSPGQWLARCPGCGQTAALMTQSLKDSFLLSHPILQDTRCEPRLGQEPSGKKHQVPTVPQMLSKRGTGHPRGGGGEQSP